MSALALLTKAVQAAKVIKVLAPLVSKKKESETKTRPVYAGGELQRVERYVDEGREFDLRRAISSAIVTILMGWAVANGYLTPEQADVVDDIIEDKIEQVIESQENA